MAQGLAQKTVLRQLHIALTVYKVCAVSDGVFF